MTLTVGSLFSGIGGLDLGLERSGMRVIWNSEIDEFACRVLKKHWPTVPNLGNIKEVDFHNVERPDVICGGYPCQPFSIAGKRQGENDERHLWPWVLHAISVLRPRYALLENVRGHLTMGGVSVIGDLTDIGYRSEWRVISAGSVGAPHRRDRVFIVAYPERKLADTNNERPLHRRFEVDTTETELHALHVSTNGGTNVAYTGFESVNGGGHRDSKGTFGERNTVQISTSGSGEFMADTNGEQLGLDRTTRTIREASTGGVYNRRGQTEYVGWQWWQVEPDLGRVAYGVPSRVDRLRGLGNAVVPQVAEVIGAMINSHAEAI